MYNWYSYEIVTEVKQKIQRTKQAKKHESVSWSLKFLFLCQQNHKPQLSIEIEGAKGLKYF
jgi:predicted nucleic acid-binding protein